MANKSIDRLSLPIQPAEFKGKIDKTFHDSTPDPIEQLMPPEDAPNVVLVMLDDTGFGQTSPFGGPSQAKTMQMLKDNSIAYNRFHTTSICSATRAALLTGRNHHSARTGVIMELATGYPGYSGAIGDDTATMAKVLTMNGYSTAAFGKWHNTPDYELGPNGPFNHWPTGLGFEHFYGFMGGESNQWNPPLYRNTVPEERPDKEGWHLSEALIDEAVSWIGAQRSTAPKRPFFTYIAPGCAHAPHHVPKEYIEKYKGKFDHGWDKERELTLERQKKLGLVPADTKLTPRPDSIKAWDELSDKEKKLYARMQEVFAGFLEHWDDQMARLVQALEDMDLVDNTLFIYCVGDNGPSGEGSLTGTLNNVKTQQGYVDDIDYLYEHMDEIGSPHFENHYPVGRCWAGSSPFQWMKQVASHFGGTRNPAIFHWPKKIKAKGELRSQFHHVIDIMPTVLEAAGIPMPETVNGIKQKPLEGVSMVGSWESADAPETHHTQYFEMFGNRAVYHKGWVAGSFHGKPPWLTSGTKDFDNDTWELYNIDEDFSQANDLADKEPEKLKEMVELFDEQAKEHSVYPLDDRFVERVDVSNRPQPIEGKKNFVYYSGTKRIVEMVAPNTKNVDHVIGAEIEIPDSGTEGCIAHCGGESGGWTVYMQDNHLVWEHNWFNEDRYVVKSDKPLKGGKHLVAAAITVDEKGKVGGGGKVELRVDGETVGTGTFDKQVPARFTANECLDIGCDLVTPTSDQYESPANFTGKINRVDINISGEPVYDLEMEYKLAMSIQ